MTTEEVAEYLKTEGVAEYLKAAEGTIYRFPAAKKFPRFSTSGIWRFRRADIGAWISIQANNVEGTD